MLARVNSFILTGIDASPCEIEVDVGEYDMSGAMIVGLPDASVNESLDRVQSALVNSGYSPPRGKMLINLAPGDVRKEGPVFDLPIAVGMLTADGVIRLPSSTPRSAVRIGAKLIEVPAVPGAKGATGAPGERVIGAGLDLRRFLFAGELALDGRLRPIRGAIAMASLARDSGFAGVILPADNAQEAAAVPGIEVYGVRTLAEVVGLLNGAIAPEPHPPVDIAALLADARASVDFAEVRGQEAVKRAITVAAAGHHNLLMLGPPGTGKTMMAKALPGVMPPLTPEEAIEITRIYSAAGATSRRGGPGPGGDSVGASGGVSGGGGGMQGLITVRPVRSPHHTASMPAIIGGGPYPTPGEVSLAHRGVLFLDELPEFPRPVLETLRQPLEDHCVTISRAAAKLRFPAQFMLVAAMNPTQKGVMPSAGDSAGRREMERYLSRLSGPLIDRIDIHVEAPAVPWKQLSAPAKPNAAGGEGHGSSSAQIRARVLAARAKQRARQGETPNAWLRGKDLDRLAPLDEPSRTMLGQAMQELGLSARAYDKVRRVSRTIADLEGSERITSDHVAEAVGYRLLDRKA